MASAEVDSPKRHLGDRSPNEVPRSPKRDRGRERRDGGDKYRPAAQERPAPPVRTEEEKQASAKAEYEKLLSMRSGGTYIPPARLRALQAQITDKTSKEYQRLMWEALKKSLNGMINKVNSSNIKHIVPELVGENLIRGRGLYCRSVMKAQAASLPFTPVFAAMTAIINSKFPAVGQLLAKRLVMQFRKGFKRSDKSVCLSATTFIAHLVNTNVIHEMLAGQMLYLLLHKPTDDSVEIAVGFMKEVGQHLQEMQPAIAMVVFDQFRNILHEADIDKRVQYMIEVLFQVRKDNFKDNPPIKEELDLVEEEDQITHKIDLDGEIDVEDGLNVFKFDPNWQENEEKYQKLKREILGEGSDDEEDDDDDESSSEEENEEQKALEIKDQSNTDLVNLRRTIYLTVMSSIDPEEATHKLMRVNLPAGNEQELPSMIVEICSQEKTYTKYHGLIGERFAKLNRLWTDLFERSFETYYSTIHRYETNRLRNIARFFAHMLASDAIGWHVLSVIHLNEEETTSSSRIFIKILFQDVAEEMGMSKLQARMKDETLQPSFTGVFPRDNAKNIRFSINYFTSIGMGALTEGMREYLQNLPKPALPAPVADDSDSDSVSSYSSYTGSSYSSRSRSRTPPRRTIDRRRSVSRSPAPRAGRARSYSRGRSPTRSPSRPASPPPRRAARDASYSASPPRRARRYSSDSRSPPPRQAAARAPLRDESPPRRAVRRNSSSVSKSPPRRAVRRNSSSASAAPRKRRYDSRSPSRASSYDSRSPSPVARRARDSPSPPPRARNARRDSYSRSPSPPPRRQAPAARDVSGDRARGRRPSPSPVNAKRRRYSDSVSRSPSPPPTKRGRRGS